MADIPHVERKGVCPRCQYRIDAASPISGDKAFVPKDGDVSFCIRCGGFNIFDKASPGGIRLPTWAEKIEIAADPDCYRLHLAWQETDEP